MKLSDKQDNIKPYKIYVFGDLEVRTNRKNIFELAIFEYGIFPNLMRTVNH